MPWQVLENMMQIQMTIRLQSATLHLSEENLFQTLMIRLMEDTKTLQLQTHEAWKC